MKPIPSPLKWHGGKHYLAKKIVALMPPHTHYVEPYFGGGSVLLAKDPEGVSEVVNDLHVELTRFWKVLQGGTTFAEFARLCAATPFSMAEWSDADLEFAEFPVFDPAVLGSDAVRAWKFFVLVRQSMAGRMKNFAPRSRTRTRRGMNEQASAWLSAVEGLPAVHERLRRVAVLTLPALEAIAAEDGPKTLFYVDAPYVRETRAAPDVYQHEMTDDQHRELVATVLGIKGRAMVSMYHHEIYDVLSQKHGWHLVEFDIANHAASGGGKKRMTECLWMNFQP